jgi:hypothetical protein
VIRRFALAACALAATTSLTSVLAGCATFDRNDAAATVGKTEISRDSLEDVTNWLVANPESEAALRLGVVDVGVGLVDGFATRYVLQVLVHDELLRQFLAAQGASPTEADIAAADSRVADTITGDIRSIYVQEEALRSALGNFGAEQQAAFLASIAESDVSVDSRYGGWNNATGTIIPLG